MQEANPRSRSLSSSSFFAAAAVFAFAVLLARKQAEKTVIQDTGSTPWSTSPSMG
jgi:hypothetical protein